jgi:UDP-N-acetylglucosamine/UDP-N-acetylgalactosamine 4-epimerase
MASLIQNLRPDMKSHSAMDRAVLFLSEQPKKWLVTGVAGFIGSHLAEHLLLLGQTVIGVDNFSTGNAANLSELKTITQSHFDRFRFLEGDICDVQLCKEACRGVDVVLHHAALGSVPRSIANPIATNANNVTGFLNVLTAAKEEGVKRFIYASSSSVYGDNADLPKVESKTGKPLSPYAVTKVANELYASIFSELYGIQTIGLRYFNVFGRRQSPEGPYAAVIPRWIQSLTKGDPVQIYGDGSTSRDFCYVKNAVQMNILAAVAPNPNGPKGLNRIFNTACNARTSLNELFDLLKQSLVSRNFKIAAVNPEYLPPRQGDIHHSQAEIADASNLLGYRPLYNVKEGIEETVDWYLRNLL